MEYQRTQTYKAQRCIVHLGSIPLTVFRLPDGSYRLSQSEISGVIEKPARSIFAFRRSKQLKCLLSMDSNVSLFEKVAVEGSVGLITPIPIEIALLYWHKWAQQGNALALALVVALAKRSIFDAANEAFGVERSEQERERILANDLSDAGVVGLKAMSHAIAQQTPVQPETQAERELKLKIRLGEVELELERLRNKKERDCLLPDGTGVKSIPGITSKAVVEDVKEILNTTDKRVAIEYIYRLGFGPRSGVWHRVKKEEWIYAIPKSKYNRLIYLLREQHLEQPLPDRFI